jgi:hypothetical protein
MYLIYYLLLFQLKVINFYQYHENLLYHESYYLVELVYLLIIFILEFCYDLFVTILIFRDFLEGVDLIRGLMLV